ncbi:MAG: DMT family transporter [Pseudomonadota bacterium]
MTAGPALTRGILLMIAAVFLFNVMDAIAKYVAHETNTVLAIWARYAGQTALVLILVAPRFRTVIKTRYPKLQLARSVLLMVATGFYFFGFVSIGLANAASVMATNPVIITLGAALFLGERFGLRRAVGVTAALIGALIIIRPGSDVFQPAALFPLAAATCYSGYALVTRFVGKDEDVWTSLLYTAAFGTLILSLIVPFYWQPLSWDLALLLGALGLFGTIGHWCLIQAFTAAEASSIAPFAYVGPIFATALGALIFQDYPDALTYVGALVIVCAGIYVWHRETRARPA